MDFWSENARDFMVFGGVCILTGLGVWWYAYRKDIKNWIVEKATPMPIHLVNAYDDVWISGITRCGQPLKVPHFGFDCLHYRYCKEEKVTSTVGKRTSSRWVTREEETLSIPFEVVDGKNSLWIYPEGASFEDLVDTGYDYDGGIIFNKWRYKATYLPHPMPVQSVGVVSEKKERLQAYKNVPLIVTLKSRGEYVKKLERGETWSRWLGLCLVVLGFFGLSSGVLHRTGWMGLDSDGRSGRIVIASLLAMISGIGFWAIYTYNRLVMYRVRVDAAWRQIDVDLKNRHDLVPNLVTVVKGYAQHEAQLFETIARLRSGFEQGDMHGRIAAEQQMAQQVRSVIALAEKYPDLKANELFLKLQEELTALEDKIAYGRKVFNDTVMEFNTYAQSFPISILFRRPQVPYFSMAMDEMPA